MPELPEVESIRRSLERTLVGPRPYDLPRDLSRGKARNLTCHLTEAHFFSRKLRFAISQKLKENLKLGPLLGPIRHVRRRAKYLLFQFDRGTLLSHLGMTGAWRELNKEQTASYQKEKHDHVQLIFNSGQSLVYSDPRRFGYLDWVTDFEKNKFLRDLGPEPLEENFDGEYLFRITRKKTTTIKAFLMNSHNVSGVGNIYANEALFMAKIKPLRKAGKLSRVEAQSLVNSIKLVLSRAIQAGGSTIRDYRGLDGSQGGFQNQHRVYGKDGQVCSVCHAGKVVSKEVTGRSTYWCPVCQKR